MKYLKLFENFPSYDKNKGLVTKDGRPLNNSDWWTSGGEYYSKDLEDSPTGNLAGLKLNGNKFSISNVIDSKQYVYKYNYNGKDLFYYNDDAFGRGTSKTRMLAVIGSDINNAHRFTGKQVKYQFLERRNRSIWMGPEMYCEQEGSYIEINENPDITEV